MIGTILRIFWIHLRRDRVVWVLTFIVPVAFFSIFAIIFSGGSGKAGTRAIPVAVVDEDGSEFSKKLLATLDAPQTDVTAGTVAVHLSGRVALPFGHSLAVLVPGHDDGRVRIDATSHAQSPLSAPGGC